MLATIAPRLLLLSLALVACVGGSNVIGPRARFDATVGDDIPVGPAFDVPTFDTPPRDVITEPIDTGAPDECEADRDCPRGRRCLQGDCVEDVCLAAETPCGGDRCEMRCVPVRDLCAAVRCGVEETCFAGRCIAGCFPAPCSGVTCAAGQFCDDATGLCARITPCPGPCDEGFACHVRCVPRTACDGVTCAPTEVCADGRCVPNPCASVTCAPGALCIDGRCTPTCGCDPPCDRSPRDRCVVGRCVCNRTCQADTPCGADDGCGGHCVGPCANPFATCDPVLYSCQCDAHCNPLGECGADDGCGGRCDQGCNLGERCDTALRRCICVSRCPPPERFGEFPCGSDVPNECAGAPYCGRGTGCPAGSRCNTTSWLCECVSDCGGDGGPPDETSGAGGGDGGACAPGALACAGRCVNTLSDGNHCGACGVQCPFGTTCVGGVCRCPAPLTLCGDRCVNVSIDDQNCGGCGTTCPARSVCENGRCRCIPACVIDPRSVTCGVNLPNACPDGPSCGVGRMCAAGEVCNTTTGQCVCVPRCPAGVQCGVSDGCGGQCAGVCVTGTCTRDSSDPRRYYCSEASCVDGCHCDEVCAANRCVRVTCATGDTPCPCQCCPFGTMCVGGARCVTVPP